MNAVCVDGEIAYRPTMVPGSQGEVMVMGLHLVGCSGHLTVVLANHPNEADAPRLTRGELVRLKGHLHVQELDPDGDGLAPMTVVVASEIWTGNHRVEDSRSDSEVMGRETGAEWTSRMPLQEPEEVFEIAGEPFKQQEAAHETP